MMDEETQINAQEPLIRCSYGLYRRRKLLQLYADYIQMDKEIYELSDLLSVEPTYSMFFQTWFASLALYFREQEAIAHFFTEQENVRILVLYLSHYHDLSRADSIGTLHTLDDLSRLIQAHADEPDYQLDLSPTHLPVESPFAPQPHGFSSLLTTLPNLSPLPVVQNLQHLPKKTQERFWRYASPDTTPVTPVSEQFATPPKTSAPGDVENHVAITQEVDSADELRTTPIIYDADPAWPWLEEDQRRRAHRLKSLQVEREQRLHGFDVEAFARRLSTEALQSVTVPLRLHPGEIAYYCVEASLCAEPLSVVRHSKRRYHLKDHGNIILTNLRIIYLGRKRQIVVSYDQLLQVVQLPDAMAVFAQYWAKRQYFAMQRPLACVMYLNRILRDYQQTISTEDFQVRTSSDEDDQATIVIDKKKLLQAQQH
jgi:hypothetical protein